MNVRHFALSDGTSWFGGGIDMTPHYVNPKEATQFHHVLKAACDAHPCADYARFKNWADDYSSCLTAAKRAGGDIFFDHLGREGATEAAAHKDFVFEVGNTFLPAARPRERRKPSRLKNASGNCTGAVATWNSTWCGTGHAVWPGVQRQDGEHLDEFAA